MKKKQTKKQSTAIKTQSLSSLHFRVSLLVKNLEKEKVSLSLTSYRSIFRNDFFSFPGFLLIYDKALTKVS